MRLPVGISITADGAQAIGTLNRVAERLENLARNPATLANNALGRFQRIGTEATQSVLGGFRDAESAWYRLGGALGVPFTMAGVVGAITGVRSLKDVLIGANSELETNRVRMSAMMRDFNDTKFSSDAKGNSLIQKLREYARDTPFEIAGLVEAATTATSVTKSPEAAFQITKLAGKLAALRGTTDVGWASQSLVGALNGNTTSLKESFGINVSEDVLQNMAMMMGFGPNSPQGRLMALQRLIEQKAGKGDGILNDLAKTGAGASAVLKDSLTMPLTDAFTPAYDKMVAGLVRFNEAYGDFVKTTGFKELQAGLTQKFLYVGQTVENVLDMISDNLERIPDILEKYGPTIRTVALFAGGIGAVNAGALILRGTLGVALNTFMAVGRYLSPVAALVTSPALVAGLLALSAVMWPTARSLEVGGKSLDTWLSGVEKWAGEKDWKGIFMRPIAALKKLLNGEYFANGGITAAIADAFGEDSLLPRITRNIVTPILTGLKEAVLESFPGLTPILERFGGAWDTLRDRLQPYLPFIGKVAIALGALTFAGRALGAASPLLSVGAVALRGIGLAIGAIGFVVANPLLVAGIAALAAVLVPMAGDLDLSAEGIDRLVSSAKDKLGGVDWAGIAGDIGKFGGELRELLLAFGEGFVSTAGPTLRIMWDMAKALAVVAWPVIQRTFEAIGGVLGLDGARAWAEAIGKVAGVLLPILAVTRGIGAAVGIARGVAAPAIGLGARVIGGAGRAASWLGMARLEVLTNPLGKLAGLRTVLAGMIAPTSMLGRILGGVARSVRWLGTARLEILTNPLGKLAGLRTVLTTMITPVQRLLAFVGRIGTAFGNIGATVARVAGPAVSTLSGFFTAMVPRVLAIGRGILPWAARLLGLTTPVGWIVTAITTLVALGVTLYRRWQPFHDLVDGIWGKIKTLPALASSLASVVGGKLKAAWSGVHELMDKVHAGIKATLTVGSRMVESIGGFIKNMPATIGGFMSSIPDRFAEVWDRAPGPLKAAVQWVLDKAGVDEPTANTAPLEGDVGGGGEVNIGYDGRGGDAGTTFVIEKIEAPMTIYSQDGTVLDSATVTAMLREMLMRELPEILAAGLSGVSRG